MLLANIVVSIVDLAMHVTTDCIIESVPGHQRLNLKCLMYVVCTYFSCQPQLRAQSPLETTIVANILSMELVHHKILIESVVD